jgi:cardiolipin synthase A/B
MKNYDFEPQPTWSRETLFTDGDAYFDRIVFEIERAQISIDVEVYIFVLDTIGRKISEALMVASGRGVKIRLLVDRMGSFGWIEPLEQLFTDSGIEFKVYHPIFRKFSWRWLNYLNQRNHRKNWIFDSRRLGVSSCNLTDSHSHAVSGSAAWVDFGMVVEGDLVKKFINEFEVSWRIRGYHQTKSDLIDFISRSNRRVWIATPYFVPTIRQLRLLFRLRARGVEIRILISQKSDIFFMPSIMSAYLGVLLGAGIKVWQFERTVFHGKVIVVDDWHRVGTSNFNHRSVFHDLETDIMVTHPENQARLCAALETSFSESREMRPEVRSLASLLGKAVTKILLFFRFWL